MATSTVLLSEIGIKSFRSKGYFATKQVMGVASTEAEGLGPVAASARQIVAPTSNAMLAASSAVKEVGAVGGAVARWRVSVRNYRTIATLSLDEAEVSTSRARALNQLADDIALAVNGLATSPILETQLMESSPDQTDNSSLQWLNELPDLIVLLAGWNAQTNAILQQDLQSSQRPKRRVIACGDLLSETDGGQRKAELWQAIAGHG